MLLPLPIEGPFDYAATTGCARAPGTFVEVPFGPRTTIGVVWDRPAPTRVAPERLKAVVRQLDAPPMPPALRRLVEHVALVNLCPLGAALKLAIPSTGGLQPPVPRQGLVAAAAPEGTRLTAGRARVLEVLADGRSRPPGELAAAAGVGAGVVQGMAKAGLLTQAPLIEPEPARPDPERRGVTLTPDQAEAAARLQALIGSHVVQLLEGVPGAGKTEVYLEAVAEALRQGLQALVLLPEIALSTQVLERFARRFGVPPAVWHSELGAPARRRTFRRIAEGREAIVVGARSALFLPFSRLGVIVVDEEHDSSFKQEDGVAYHAREMAVARGRFEDCPVILVSATPALDTAWRAGRIPAGRPVDQGAGPILLPARHGGAALPGIHLLDLKADKPGGGRWLAPSLERTLRQTLEAGEQALLFLNRRGFAPLTLCRACGFRVRCPNCAAWLVEHRFRRRLVCHHCGYGRPSPEFCPDCGALESLVACGPGVERLADEVQQALPAARVRIMTSDNPASAGEAAALVRAMHDHEVDVLIGTQIIAKGHHFPDLTLVGVVDGDLGLAGGDLRAAERQFQLLYQVAGRAGRAERPGVVLIQTHFPEHPVMRALAAGDKDSFYLEELAERRAAGLPPFGRLAALIVSGRDAEQVQGYAQRLARQAPRVEGLRVLGPAPAPLALLRGRHRMRLLVMAPAELDLARTLQPWLAAAPPRGNLRLQVDVDPYSFL